MSPEIQNAKIDALSKGWIVEVVSIDRTDVFQLKNPQGKYVQFGGTEESVWRHAYERGILPMKP